jgi:hypothetical protein
MQHSSTSKPQRQANLQQWRLRVLVQQQLMQMQAVALLVTPCRRL